VIPESFPAAGGHAVRDLFRLASVAGAGISSKERKEREEELLSMVGLHGVQEAGLTSLSVSERARIALAVELFRGPKVLFADMLLHNAGEEWAEMLRGLFRALAREGKTVLLAERAIPGKWKSRGVGEGTPAGPFLLFRLASKGDVPR
jgi:ABC-type multidrug transport system ATPase subunit